MTDSISIAAVDDYEEVRKRLYACLGARSGRAQYERDEDEEFE